MLPWRLIAVQADGRCALHATAVALGYDTSTVVRKLLAHYRGTYAHGLIRKLAMSGTFMEDSKIEGFECAHVANPMEFRDFITSNSSWIKGVVTVDYDYHRLRFRDRMNVPHAEIVRMVHGCNRHNPTTRMVESRQVVIFLNYLAHWYVLLPYERTISRPL